MNMQPVPLLSQAYPTCLSQPTHLHDVLGNGLLGSQLVHSLLKPLVQLRRPDQASALHCTCRAITRVVVS